MSVLGWLGVVVASGLGAVARFVVDARVSGRLGSRFPFGTLAVNLSGALVLGTLSGLALSHDTALLAGTATVGSYTTFSTWMFETERLAADGERALAAANVAVSLAAGIGAVALGRLIGAQL